ncbi:MAG: Asp23/Gls24 family envelope stress response protein [Bacilli bacterium]
MPIEIKNELGTIDVRNEVIATLAGGATVECFGVVGMVSKSGLRDGLTDILKRENFSKGVVVRQEEDRLHIDLYIIVSYGTKISEVASNVQSKVKYTLQQTLGLTVDSVNVIVQGVKVIN